MATKKPAAKKAAAKKPVPKRSAAKKSAKAPVAGIPEPIARQLLKLLSTDDGFRRRFSKNPSAGLLEAAGVSPQAAACCKPKKLANKKAIAEAHDEMLESLTKKLDYQPVKMDTGR